MIETIQSTEHRAMAASLLEDGGSDCMTHDEGVAYALRSIAHSLLSINDHLAGIDESLRPAAKRVETVKVPPVSPPFPEPILSRCAVHSIEGCTWCALPGLGLLPTTGRCGGCNTYATEGVHAAECRFRVNKEHYNESAIGHPEYLALAREAGRVLRECISFFEYIIPKLGVTDRLRAESKAKACRKLLRTLPQAVLGQQ